MDKCKITPDQITSLLSGKSVILEYQTMEDYGQMFSHKIELVPNNPIVECINCGSTNYSCATHTFNGDGTQTGSCNLCE